VLEPGSEVRLILKESKIQSNVRVVWKLGCGYACKTTIGDSDGEFISQMVWHLPPYW
jgi:hypothetical protein